MSYGYRYPTETGGASFASIVTFVHPYWTGLKRYWWIPAICAGLAAGGMLLMIKKQPPPQFVSSARIWIGLRSVDASGGARALSDSDGTQLEVMNSPDLRNRAENAVQAANPSLRVTRVRLYASKVKDTSIYQLQAYGGDAAYTKAFLESFIDTYLKYLKESFVSDLNNTADVIGRKLESVDREMREKKKRLEDFRDDNSVELIKQKAVSSSSLYQRLESEYQNLQLELEKLEQFSLDQILDQDSRASVSSAPSSLRNVSADPSSGITDDPEARALMGVVDPLTAIHNARLNIESMKYELAELSKDLRPKHPKVKELTEMIAKAENQLELLVKQNTEKYDERKKRIKKELETLKDPIQRALKDTEDFDKKMAEYTSLQADVDRLQPQYDQLLKATDALAMREGMTDYTMKELDPPSPARAQTVDNVTKMIVAVSVGLLLGVGVVCLIVFFDDRVKSLTALKAAFQEPVLGQVPNVGTTGGNEPIDLLKEDDDRHNFVESFRNIRSSILFMDAGETRPKTIVITSAIPSEGKSSVAANLAKTMAMSGSKVLLVDGDQRRCSINEKMGLPVGPGFSDVLTGKMKFEEALLNPNPNLFVLVRGTTIKNPGELFVGDAADNFLRSVYDKFDYILIDTPPVLAADDVTSLAPKVDGVLFVIRAEHTSARLAKQSLELLYNRHVRVMGLIYNRANLFLPEYSYYKYSSYYNKPEETAG